MRRRSASASGGRRLAFAHLPPRPLRRLHVFWPLGRLLLLVGLLLGAGREAAAVPMEIKIGLLIPQNTSLPYAFSTSAAAIPMAIDRLFRDRVLTPATVNFTILYHFEECEQATAAGLSYELLTNQSVDVLIASPCTDGATVEGHLATYYNIPVMMWGSTLVSDLANPILFPTVVNIMPTYADFSKIICDVMEKFKWTTFSFIYQADDNGGCFEFQRDLEKVAADRSDCVVSFKDVVDTWDPEDINYTITNIQQRSRIVVLCFDDIDQKRSFALSLFDAGLHTEDFVYIFPDTDMLLADDQARPFWIDRNSPVDGRDADAEAIGRRGFQVVVQLHAEVDASNREAFTYANFSADLISRMRAWPFYCTACDQKANASMFAPYLYDLFYIYGMSLARTFNQSGPDARFYRNGTLISDNANVEFEGLTGRVVMGTDGVRDSSYVLSEYDKDDQLREFILFQVVGNQVNVSDLVNESQIWASRAGFRPLAVPLCGFDGKGCPAPVWQQYMALFISVIVVVVLIIASLLAVCFYILHSKSVETRRLNEAWQISFAHLSRVTSKKEAESSRSLQSGPSTTSTKFTFDTVKSSKNFNMYRLENELVIARKYQVRRSLSAENMAELRLMRQMDHENVLKFIGLSIDGPEFMSIWRFCGRGSLQDVIERGNMNIDAFFVYSLIRDLAEGLHYIHHSPLQTHGRLKSSYCLIDDRWQAKISYYGLSFLRDQTSTREARDLLWTAPELLRNGDDKPTKQADVYSFAIVCSEIINMKPAWDNEMKGNHEEVVYLVKKGGARSIRPSLEPEIADISQGIFHLVRDCWGEDPSHRPKSDQIRAVLKSLNGGRNASLMDHVFAILEQHASNLEMEVEEQTKQLVEEKKRSDVLLYRMLPRQVAEKLKLGQSVELSRIPAMKAAAPSGKTKRGTVPSFVRSDFRPSNKPPTSIDSAVGPREESSSPDLFGHSPSSPVCPATEPESFDCVTIFFSDVVSFTTIASKCTPLQVISLLNDFYTTLDSIIAEYDVYKVETIGDGYLCVSGLPKRNGNQHAKHIADMSLHFMRALKNFTIPHLPGERVRLRIGIHTGPCVAGVVGLAMPRYCLFGDTVNTASRMESNGKPERIHLSGAANDFLLKVIGGYETESRGEVIIKGKGVMQTYFLLGTSAEYASNTMYADFKNQSADT